jgi:hypothetical protein
VDGFFGGIVHHRQYPGGGRRLAHRLMRMAVRPRLEHSNLRSMRHERNVSPDPATA